MKRFLFAALLGFAATASAAALHGREGEPRILREGIRFCESTYPYRDGMLIANFGTGQLNPLNTEGKGYILYSRNGENEILLPADGNLSAPKGMFMRDSRLFICDVNKIVVYDLSDREKDPLTIPMPEGDLFVNDLAALGDTLFVSVTNSDRIYRIDLSDPARPGSPVEWLRIPGPNGLLVHDGMLYVASYPADGTTRDEHVVYRIADPEHPQPERFVEIPGQYDGLALSGDGRALYVTNWAPARISRIDLRTKAMTTIPLELEQEMVGPADLTVKEGKIYIPDLPNSRVIVVEE